MKTGIKIFVISTVLLLTVFSAKILPAEQEGAGKLPDKSQVSTPKLEKEEFIQKTKKLQMPFIANEGQTDVKVAFYANTFGGTVFVTKNGEIVYALPKSGDVEDGETHRKLVLDLDRGAAKCAKERSEKHISHKDTKNTQGEINKDKTGYTGLTGYMGKEGQCIVHNTLCTLYPFCRWNFPDCHSERSEESYLNNSQSEIPNPKSEFYHHNTPDSYSPNPKSAIQNLKSGIALKETLIGAKVNGITGEQPSITKVNYFKGNDPSKWKTNVSTYDYVNLGEIYKGIELKLKAYGDNVEKLFCVKPGADPEQIKISLSGIQPPESPFIKGDLTENPPPTPASGGQAQAGSGLQPEPLNLLNTGVCAVDTISKGINTGVQVANLNPQGGGIQPSENPPPLSPSLRGTGACPPLAGAGGGLGARGLSVNEHGELEVATELGPVKFTKPVAYQVIDGKRVNVECGYVIAECEGISPQNTRKDTKLRFLDTFAFFRGISEVINTEYVITHPLPLSRGEYKSPLLGGDSGVGKSAIQNLSSTSIGDPKSTNSDSKNPQSKIQNPKLEYSFTVASYDHTKDLIIDPLLASTYLGGSGGEHGNSLTLDTSGNVYVTGVTVSTDFPTTSGAYDTSLNGYSDVFVSKLNGGLTSLLASTYLGG